MAEVICGKEKIVGWYQTISSTNLRTCKNCGMQSKARDRIGKIIGIIKILEFYSMQFAIKEFEVFFKNWQYFY